MRTARRKRPLQLLDILASIRDAVPAAEPLRAVLVGSGPLDGAIRRKLAATGMDRWVTHTGQLDRTEIRGLLHRSDLYLAPAELESFGIAALEARSAGLPVIGMARCGIRDFVSEAARASWSTPTPRWRSGRLGCSPTAPGWRRCRGTTGPPARHQLAPRPRPAPGGLPRCRCRRRPARCAGEGRGGREQPVEPVPSLAQPGRPPRSGRAADRRRGSEGTIGSVAIR